MDTNKNKKLVEKEVEQEETDGSSDSGSESSGLMLLQESLELEQRLLSSVGLRKRLRFEPSSRSGSESALSDDEAPAPKVGTSRRGRGRPSTTGDYVGLAKAKADLMAVRREESRLQAEDDIGALVKAAQLKSVEMPARPVPGEVDDRTAAALREQIAAGIGIVDYVARKSGNLKGTFTKALKEATGLIAKGSDGLRVMSASEDSARLEATVNKLQADNTRLQADNTRLQAEMEALRLEVALIKRQSQPATEAAPPAESEMFRLFRTEMANLTTRFGVLEGKILRPPLACDRRVTEKTPAATYAAKAAGQSRAPAPASASTSAASSKGAAAKSAPAKAASAKAAPAKAAVSAVAAPKATQMAIAEGPTTSGSSPKAASSQPKGKGKGKGKKTPQAQDAAASTQGARSANEPIEGEWQTVTNKKKAAKKAANKRSRQRKRAARLQAPRSTAVVIALQPGAEAKGFTYASVLLKAKTSIKLEELGISSLGFKLSITGARILEVPGAESGDKADALASKMRELFSTDDVRISRPTKCAELRVSDLDDSVTSGDVAAVAARVGGCSADDIKVGELRRGSSGKGSVWLRCPVAAAKAIATAGRLLVGWSSAKVTLLEPRPLQCFRCLYGGHVQHTCSSEVDRSEQCYRCSQPGHRANQCSADLHCSLCEAEGKPADHRVGTKACVAFEKRKKKGRATGSGPQRTQSSATQAMDTTTSAPSS